MVARHSVVVLLDRSHSAHRLLVVISLREELNELGNMLVRGLPMEEIARLLRRDHGEVQDKVVEIGRACR